ncbi:hypothetical protein NEOLEDRAFT_1220970 [Neolentinus lepideus HHB14362 ss-1]|uniref:Uncharacterized protein n=1 Tax=Neolentinus lepideus HHB14362 ss-1 TaxID=1314782 RepID=A0A165Q6Y4_9AGAM|nr:hypothetical protein NEOLEDRAFT_1220970 [Neolentinus lepideus HHB14362 ss-1]
MSITMILSSGPSASSGSSALYLAYKVSPVFSQSTGFSESLAQGTSDDASIKSWYSWYEDYHLGVQPSCVGLKRLARLISYVHHFIYLKFYARPSTSAYCGRTPGISFVTYHLTLSSGFMSYLSPSRSSGEDLKYFPHGPPLPPLPRGGGGNLPVPVVTPSKLRGLIYIPSPSLLHLKWKPRKTQRKTSHRIKSASQASFTPILGAVAGSIASSTSGSLVFLPILETPAPFSQWRPTASDSVPVPVPVWLTSESPVAWPFTITATTEELSLPVQVVPIVNMVPQASNAERKWKPSNFTRDRSFSLPGADYLVPMLRHTKTREEIMAGNLKRMSDLIFDVAEQDHGKKKEVLVKSHRRMSDVMGKMAKKDAMMNSAGLPTPPATPNMDNGDLEANWRETTRQPTGPELDTTKIIRPELALTAFPSLPDDSGNFTIGDDEDQEDALGFNACVSNAIPRDTKEEHQANFSYGDTGSSLLSHKVSTSLYKNYKSVEAMRTTVAPEVQQDGCEAVIADWTPEVPVELNEEHKKCDGREYSSAPERKVRAKLFRDVKKDQVSMSAGSGVGPWVD